MGEDRYYARACADEALVAQIATDLASWDPDCIFRAPDDSTAPESHARAILGILAAGGQPAAIKGYLRHAEINALGAPRSTSEERGDRADRISRWMVVAAVRAAAAARQAD